MPSSVDKLPAGYNLFAVAPNNDTQSQLDVSKYQLVSGGNRAQVDTHSTGLVVKGSDQIAVSAKTGAGCDDLLNRVDVVLAASEKTLRLTLAPEDGAGLAWAYANGRVLERRSGEKGLYLVIAADPETVDRFEAHFPGRITIVETDQRREAASS